MAESKFRLISIVVLFLAVFALKSRADESGLSGEAVSLEVNVTEMDRAIRVAQEIQALNNGDFSSQKGPFHPDQQPQLNIKTLSLSVNSK